MTDIVERLKNAVVAAPSEGRDTTVDVGLLNEAYFEIVGLRSEVAQLRSLGIAAVGPSFAELTKDVPRRSAEERAAIEQIQEVQGY